MGLIPGSGRSPGGGHSNPLQYCCLENPMDRGARQTTVHGIKKSQTRLKWLSIQGHMQDEFVIIELESKNPRSWNITGPRLQTAPSWISNSLPEKTGVPSKKVLPSALRSLSWGSCSVKSNPPQAPLQHEVQKRNSGTQDQNSSTGALVHAPDKATHRTANLLSSRRFCWWEIIISPSPPVVSDSKWAFP